MRNLLPLLLVSALAIGAAPPRPQGSAHDQALVVAVEVPVQVSRDGVPVRGLTAANFAVFEGDRSQPITAFEVVDLAPAGPTPAIAPLPLPAPAGRRYFVLLFDMAFSRPAALVKARRAANDLVANRLLPSDLVALATYRRTRGLDLLLGFTADRALLARALGAIGQPELFDRAADPLRLTLAQADEKATDILLTRLVVSGNSPNDETTDLRAEVRALADEQLIAELRAAELSDARQQRSDLTVQIKDLTESWRNLSHLLGTVGGRKYVLFLSEGFDARLLTGATPERRDQAALESGETWTVDTEARFGSGAARGPLDRLLEELRRDDCVVYSIDIGGVRAAADAQAIEIRGDTVVSDPALGGHGEEGLVTLAHDTGGELVRNFNDLGAAMGKVLERTAVTYVLVLQPAGLKPDGTYHPLRVELRGVARGARLSHRAGYYAPRPYSDRSAAERNLLTARLLATRADEGGLSVDLLAAPLPGDGTAEVPVVVEVAGGPLLEEHWGNDLETAIYLYAFDARGAVADFLVQRLNLDLTKVGDTLRNGGIRFFGRLRLPPGEVALRALVRNERTGAYRLRSLDLAVPDFAVAGPRLLTPLLPEPGGNRWLAVRSPRWGANGEEFPYRHGNRLFFPTARPRFAAGSKAELWIPTIGLVAESAALRVELVAADGARRIAGEAVVGPIEPAGATALARSVAFRAPGPGVYEVRAALDLADGRSLSSPPVTVEVLAADSHP